MGSEPDLVGWGGCLEKKSRQTHQARSWIKESFLPKVLGNAKNYESCEKIC